MIRKKVLTSVVAFLFALVAQHILPIRGQDECLWCDKRSEDRFLNCLYVEMSNNPALYSLPLSNFDDMKHGISYISDTNMGAPVSVKWKMMDEVMVEEVQKIAKAASYTGQISYAASLDVVSGITGHCYSDITKRNTQSVIDDIKKIIVDIDTKSDTPTDNVPDVAPNDPTPQFGNPNPPAVNNFRSPYQPPISPSNSFGPSSIPGAPNGYGNVPPAQGNPQYDDYSPLPQNAPLNNPSPQYGSDYGNPSIPSYGPQSQWGNPDYQPGDDYPQPYNPQSQPGDDYPQPDNPQSQPGDDYPQPDNPQSQPGDDYPQPDNPQSQPGDDYPQPDNPQSQPGDDYPQPDNPQSQENNPSSGFGSPFQGQESADNSGMKVPSSENASPNSGLPLVAPPISGSPNEGQSNPSIQNSPSQSNNDQSKSKGNSSESDTTKATTASPQTTPAQQENSQPLDKNSSNISTTPSPNSKSSEDGEENEKPEEESCETKFKTALFDKFVDDPRFSSVFGKVRLLSAKSQAEKITKGGFKKCKIQQHYDEFSKLFNFESRTLTPKSSTKDYAELFTKVLTILATRNHLMEEDCDKFGIDIADCILNELPGVPVTTTEAPMVSTTDSSTTSNSPQETTDKGDAIDKAISDTLSEFEANINIEKLYLSAKNCNSPSGFDFDRFGSKMDSVFNDLQKNHPDWSVEECEDKTKSLAIIALTQALQDHAVDVDGDSQNDSPPPNQSDSDVDQPVENDSPGSDFGSSSSNNNDQANIPSEDSPFYDYDPAGQSQNNPPFQSNNPSPDYGPYYDYDTPGPMNSQPYPRPQSSGFNPYNGPSPDYQANPGNMYNPNVPNRNNNPPLNYGSDFQQPGSMMPQSNNQNNNNNNFNSQNYPNYNPANGNNQNYGVNNQPYQSAPINNFGQSPNPGYNSNYPNRNIQNPPFQPGNNPNNYG
ncbi:hypothetical protein CDAR_85191 [Caerostris darwini]|uniref:Uncharacterized protein n=1 Tax=Caerostris darwini TaxID=1538125 RepID=A0AAV4MZ65_9ARAC|nr:hypothetical protein CDAR_85191 [Caerostris darwini]